MKIIYTRGDGGLSVIHPVPIEMLNKHGLVFGVDITTNEEGEKVEIKRPLTQQEYEQHIWEKSVPIDAINPKWVEDDSVPIDREFRNAWTHDGINFGYDLEKARAIQLAKIRDARAPKLAELDIAYQRADEVANNEQKQVIAKQKQVLRDITNSLKQATLNSIDDVKNAYPAELGGNV